MQLLIYNSQAPKTRNNSQKVIGSTGPHLRVDAGVDIIYLGDKRFFRKCNGTKVIRSCVLFLECLHCSGADKLQCIFLPLVTPPSVSCHACDH